jgi:hypothetical protein
MMHTEPSAFTGAAVQLLLFRAQSPAPKCERTRDLSGSEGSGMLRFDFSQFGPISLFVLCDQQAHSLVAVEHILATWRQPHGIGKCSGLRQEAARDGLRCAVEKCGKRPVCTASMRNREEPVLKAR